MRRERSQVKNLKHALEAHMRELEDFYHPLQPTPELSANDSLKLWNAFESAVGRHAPSGRPPLWHSKNQRTAHSFGAFVFVAAEMRIFRQRHRVREVPRSVKTKFIEFALQDWKEADVDLIEDNLRKYQGLLPQHPVPTGFLYMQFPCENGTVTGVIISSPANERLSALMGR